MSLVLTLTPHVRSDPAAARQWYDHQKPGLGDDFAREFYIAIDWIRQAPTAQTRWGDSFRKRRLSVYPYSVFFHVADTDLFVVALKSTVAAPASSWRANSCALEPRHRR